MLFIDNHWVAGKGKNLISFSPLSHEELWNDNQASISQANQAVLSAVDAFDGWKKSSLNNRLKIIKKFYKILVQEQDFLANLISLETGKLLEDSKSEVAAASAKLGNSIKAYKERTGSKVKALGSSQQAITHFPHGPMAIIGPFNFPLHLPNGHITPALLAGNTVVFKPSEQTPLVGEAMVLLWERAGIPKGVINLVQGDYRIGEALVKHKLIRGVLFTGGIKAGLKIHKHLAGQPNKILALELGGNNPLVAWNTKKISRAVEIITTSAFLSSGQRCTCARRLILQNSTNGKAIADSLLKHAKLIGAEIKNSKHYGPLINSNAAKNFIEFQQKLIDHGGRVLLRGKIIFKNGSLVSPAIIDMTKAKKFFDEEVFGPMLQIKFVENFEEAINEANNTNFGLSAGLISDNGSLFEIFQRDINAGIVNFNSPITGASGSAPFGGVGKSGNHRPAGYYAADYCAWPKASVISESN